MAPVEYCRARTQDTKQKGKNWTVQSRATWENRRDRSLDKEENANKEEKTATKFYLLSHKRLMFQ